MKIRKNIIHYISVVSMLVVTVAWVSTSRPVWAQSELTTTFTNDTGKDVNDLHIKYTHDVSITQNPKKFSKVKGTNLKVLTKGTVAAGDSIEITAKRDSGDIDINKWWWTIDGEPEGEVHTGCMPPACSGSDAGSGTTQSIGASDMLEGVVTVGIKTDKGQIKLKLPNDMRAGETVSGSLVDERQGATDELSGAVVEINGQKYTIREKMLTFIVPPMTDTLGAALKSKTGKLIAKFNLPRQSSLNTISPNNFQLPALGQQGRNIVINGPFDGNLSNTTCTIGGQPVKKLAESGRMSVFESPMNIVGLTDIKLNEVTTESKGEFRNVGIKLTAEKTKLVKGEQAQTTVSVNVGQNLRDPIDVQISSAGAVDMQGGNLQTIQIQPSQVGSDGTFTKTFLLTGTQAGTFTVKATVNQPNPTTGKSDCKCKCEFAKTPIVSAGKRAAEGGGTEYSFKPSVNTGCSGNRCEVQSIAYSWSIGAGSTATHTLHAGTDKVEKLVVDVTTSGTLVLTVTVTVTCSDGTTCTDTATKTFDVKK